MSYITYPDFRTATLAEYCAGLALGTADATDAQLTSAIDRMGLRLDDYTNDHFESEQVTLSLTGTGETRLVMPKRCTAVSTVTVLDSYGTATIQGSTVYRLVSSLYSAGSKRQGDVDYLELIYGAGGLSGYPFSQYDPCVWPTDANSIQVAGVFGWTTTPADVKRATALLVWDHFKPLRGDLRRASRYATTDVTVEMGLSEPTGILEVDDIIEKYLRPEPPGTG